MLLNDTLVFKLISVIRNNRSYLNDNPAYLIPQESVLSIETVTAEKTIKVCSLLSSQILSFIS